MRLIDRLEDLWLRIGGRGGHNSRMRHISRLVTYSIMLAFAAWCMYLLHGDLTQLSLAPVLRSWDLVIVATVLSLLNYTVRVHRWRSYLARLGHPLPFRFAVLTYTAGFAYTLSPGKVGEMVRARYYGPLGVPISSVAATFIVERLMDLMAMVVLAALLFTSSSRYGALIVAAAAAVAAILASLTLLPWTRLNTALTAANRIPGALRSALVRLTSALASTRVLLRPGMLAAGFTAGLLAWGLEGAGLGLLSSMFAPLHLDPASAMGIYGIAVLVGGLSFLPGGLGSTEAVMAALLVTRGYSVGQALLVTLTCRLVTLWLAVFLGWAAVFALRQKAPAMVLPWR